MIFTPATKEELEMEGLIKPGYYPFGIVKVEEKTSQKGDPFFNVRLAVYVGSSDKPMIIFDNPSPAFMKHKLAHLCEATGNQAKYESGNLSESDLVGAEAFIEVGVQPAKGGYPAKNTVLDYLTREQAQEMIRQDQSAMSEPVQTLKKSKSALPDDSDFLM